MSLPVPEDMRHLINYDEKVIWVLRGNETVVVSDQRIIIRRSGGLGLKRSFVDYPYSNMVNIKLDRGVRRASVEILMRSGVQSIRIDNLSKPDAFQLHRVLRENIIKGTNTNLPQSMPLIIQSSERPNSHEEGNGDQHSMCGKCGHRVSPDFTLCPFCRNTLKIECPECARKINSKFNVCPYCGEDLFYIEQPDYEL